VQRFRGAVRQATIHDFESRLREGGERSPYYIVDLSELEYIEAAGLGRLLEQSSHRSGAAAGCAWSPLLPRWQ